MPADPMFWMYAVTIAVAAASGIASLPWDVRSMRDAEGALRAVQEWFSPAMAPVDDLLPAEADYQGC